MLNCLIKTNENDALEKDTIVSDIKVFTHTRAPFKNTVQHILKDKQTLKEINREREHAEIIDNKYRHKHIRYWD